MRMALYLASAFGLVKMGGGVAFGMPTPERQEVSAPSWGTCLRLFCHLHAQFFARALREFPSERDHQTFLGIAPEFYPLSTPPVSKVPPTSLVFSNAR